MGFPYSRWSVALKGKFSSNNEFRTSRKGKSNIHALKSSGLIFIEAYATIIPPDDYPLEASKLGWVIFFAIKNSAQLIKSSIEFVLLCNFP